MRVLVIGLDGATWSVLKPLMREGYLPTLKQLSESGVSGYLESTIPPVTGAAWPAIATGRSPGKTGIIDHLRRINEDSFTLRPISSHDIRGIALWDYLNISGFKVGIFNFPLLYPPYKVNGFMISGIGASPEQEITYPPSLKRELEEVTGGYQIHVNYREEKYDDIDLFIKDLNIYMDKFEKAARYLVKNKDWDLFFMVVSATDWIQHYMWKHIDPSHPLYDPELSPVYASKFREFWRRVDDLIGEIVRLAGRDTIVFIISDHGFGPSDQTFNLTKWLELRGYLVRRGRRGYLRSFRKLLLNKLLIPIGRSKLKRLIPYKVRRSISAKMRTSIIGDVDLEKSTAICLGHTIGFGAIYVNVKEERRRREVLDRLLRELKEIDVDIGLPVKVTVYEPKRMYEGERVNLLPDVIFTINDWRCVIVETDFERPLFERKPISPRRTGSHRPLGVFIAYGPSIKRGYGIKRVKVYDLAPTILHIFDLPIPDDMDGRVLVEIFEKGSEPANRRPRYVSAHNYALELRVRRMREILKRRARRRRLPG